MTQSWTAELSVLASAPIRARPALRDEIALVNEVEISGQHKERNVQELKMGLTSWLFAKWSSHGWSHGVQAGVSALLGLSVWIFPAREVPCSTAAVTVMPMRSNDRKRIDNPWWPIIHCSNTWNFTRRVVKKVIFLYPFTILQKYHALSQSWAQMCKEVNSYESWSI